MITIERQPGICLIFKEYEIAVRGRKDRGIKGMCLERGWQLGLVCYLMIFKMWTRDMGVEQGTAVKSTYCGNELSERGLWNNNMRR